MNGRQDQADGRVVVGGREKEFIWRDRRVGGEREERHGSQSAHTVEQVVLCCVISDTFTQSLYTWKGEMFKWHFVLLSPSLSPSPATPLNTEYLSTKTKQKGNMRALSHSDTDHYIELERGDRQFPSKPQKSKIRGVPKKLVHKEVPVLLVLNLHGLNEISDMVKTTDVNIMEEF